MEYDLSFSSLESLNGCGCYHFPRQGVPPSDSAWKEGVAIYLDVTRDYLVFVWVVILYTVWERRDR